MSLFNKKYLLPLPLLVSSLLASLAGCAMQQAQPDGDAKSDTAQVVQPASVEPAKPDPLAQLADLESGYCAPPANLWDRVRKDFRLPQSDHERIKTDVEWFSRHGHYLERVVERARPYLYLVVEAVEKRDIPTELALLPVVESAYQPFAYSHGRAAGLWQFVPGTGRRFGLKQTWWYDGRRDVAESTRAALDYLQYLHDEFDGDWLLALAAYNSGEGTVAAAIRRNRRHGKPTDFFSLDLPDETRDYVPRLLAISRIIADPQAYGVKLDEIPNKPFLAKVNVGSQIDLDLAAELAGLSIEDIYRYNPGFNRWATDPNGPFDLLLPREQAVAFEQRLAEYPANQRINWTRHTIRSGETLGTLAEHYRTTVSLIKRVNRIEGNSIRAGHTLIIPVARTSLKRYGLSAEQRLAKLKKQPHDGNRIDYEVQPGDTLWEIARRYNVGVRSLAKWNGMAPLDPLKPGQNLVIWTQDERAEADTDPEIEDGLQRVSATAINPADFVHPFQKNIHRRIGYRVRKGDSLASISERFRVSVGNLVRWNNLKGRKYLRPGQHLTLYVDVIRQSGSI